MNNLKIIFVLSSFFIFITILSVLYYWSRKNIDNFVISPIRGGVYDPDIEKLSGGMAGFSTSPYYRWSYSLYPREYPYFDIPYCDGSYIPNSIYSRDFYDYPYTYECDQYFCSPIYDPVFDNPRVHDLLMSGE